MSTDYTDINTIVRPELDIHARSPMPYMDDLFFYRARIYDNCSSNDDRLQVRILPYMADITEVDNLPKYPPFFRGQVIRGFTEKEKGDANKKEASMVWVVATPDFTYGFILGLANNFDSIAKTPMTDSWNYQEVKQSLQRSGAISQDFDYNNMIIDYCNPGASLLQIRGVKSGEIYWITASGSCITLQPDKVYISAREGNESGAMMSSIMITPEKISLTSDLIEINGKKIMLGKRGMKILSTYCEASETYNGMNLVPVENVYT